MKFFVMHGLMLCRFLIIPTGVTGLTMLGPGRWSPMDLQRCDADDHMPWSMDVRRHRLNRSHYVYDADITLTETLDNSYGFRAELCKMVDGGCKLFRVIIEDSMAEYFKRLSPKNVRAALEALGLDPPDFPVPAGTYHAENFLVDTNDLVKVGIYGEYRLRNYVVKDGQDVACFLASITFTPLDPWPLF